VGYVKCKTILSWSKCATCHPWAPWQD